MKTIPVLLLTGYLGAGKTTLLNRILNNRRRIRFAVIVNDLGEINIDAELIAKGGVVGKDPDAPDLVALQNGCICCTLQPDLIRQIQKLCDPDLFDYIVIEASGICDPAPIANTIFSLEHSPAPRAKAIPRLDCIVALVDALRLQTEFNSGEDILAANPEDEDNIANLLAQQIEFCNIVVINKTDLVEPGRLAQIRRIVREIQPMAEIMETVNADVPLEKILNTGLFDFEKVATSAKWVREIEAPMHDDDDDDDVDSHHHHHHHEHGEHEEHGEDCHCGHCHHHHHHEGEADEYGVSTFVYFRRRPFNFDRFDYLADHWPGSIIRSKGVIYFSLNRDMSILFEQAGRHKSIKEAGLWLATAPKRELEAIARQDPSVLRDWDPEYGDRMIKLAIIGKGMNRAEIEKQLDSCLD